MDLIKLYLSQSISAAANNLRLNSRQIEIVSLLKETLFKSEKTDAVIKKMKKITELSTLAIKLDEIYRQLIQGPVDLSKLSDKFKLHSQNLVKDLFVMLNNANLANLKIVFEKINNEDKKQKDIKPETETDAVSERADNETDEENKIEIIETKEIREELKPEVSDKDAEVKEKLILEDNTEAHTFESFEKSILEPIKTLDNLLKQLDGNNELPEDFKNYSGIMETNSLLSEKNGFEILAGLHSVIADSIKLISAGELKPEKENIESMRACLIVIVAIIRSKEVDITNYLNKAEQFGSKIKSLRIKKEN